MEPWNRFQGINSARLRIDSWAPYKVYKLRAQLYKFILTLTYLSIKDHLSRLSKGIIIWIL